MYPLLDNNLINFQYSARDPCFLFQFPPLILTKENSFPRCVFAGAVCICGSVTSRLLCRPLTDKPHCGTGGSHRTRVPSPCPTERLIGLASPFYGSVSLITLDDTHQLIVRVQPREVFVVTQARCQPPVGGEWTECRRAVQRHCSVPIVQCVSGSLGKKCNNYL
jgi:hypothetical protein